MPLKIAVLTVSDTRNLKDDKSGALLVQRIVAAGHLVAERSIVSDDIEAIRARVKAWIADPVIDVIITTGGTGFTGRDVTPEAVEPLFEKKMDAFSALFLVVSFPEDRHVGDPVARDRGRRRRDLYFCLPGSPGACKDAWDEILVHQLDYRYGPCNFVEIMPRLDEHLRRREGARVRRCSVMEERSAARSHPRNGLRISAGLAGLCDSASLAMPGMTSTTPNPSARSPPGGPSFVPLRAHQLEAGFLVDVPRGGEHAVRP